MVTSVDEIAKKAGNKNEIWCMKCRLRKKEVAYYY